MKIVEASARYTEMSGNQLELIEMVGRTCYKSEDKKTKDSARKFVDRLVNSGHWAMLEFGYVYMKASHRLLRALRKYLYPKFHAEYKDDWNIAHPNHIYLNIVNEYITGSFRAFHDIFDDCCKSEWCEKNDPVFELLDVLADMYPEVFVRERYNHQFATAIADGYSFYDSRDPVAQIFDRDWYVDSVKEENSARIAHNILYNTLPHLALFTADRAVCMEMIRHRPCSFAMESTRYCSYDRGKFGKEITVVKPCFLEESDSNLKWKAWKLAMTSAEAMYMSMLELGCTAQEARSVLPNSLKADLWVCATEKEWKHILNLRLAGKTGKPHPQMVEVMEQLEPQIEYVTDGRVGCAFSY